MDLQFVHQSTAAVALVQQLVEDEAMHNQAVSLACQTMLLRAH